MKVSKNAIKLSAVCMEMRVITFLVPGIKNRCSICAQCKCHCVNIFFLVIVIATVAERVIRSKVQPQ